MRRGLIRRLRHTAVALAAAAALGAAAPARADPVTIVTVAAYAASAAGVIAATTAAYVALAAGIIGGVMARRKAKRAAADARAAGAAALQDRCVTLMTAEPEPKIIYGRCAVGGWVIDKITTAKTYLDDQGVLRTKPDAYQHVVIGLGCHEVHAIHDVFMYGEWLGVNGADGWVAGGPADAPYGKPHNVVGTSDVTFSGGAATLPAAQAGYTITRVISISRPLPGDGGDEVYAGQPALSGSTVTGGPASGGWRVTYEISKVVSSVRVEFHTGSPDQAASPFLMSVAPSYWTSAHRLRGIPYVVLTFDLDDGRHQGIPGDLAFDVSGRKVLDPRTGVTAWSRNAALCTYDWMLQRWGMSLTQADIRDVAALANICDQQVSLVVGGTTTTGPRYTIDGAFGANADRAATLADMTEAMGGFASQGAQWGLHAGAWTAPVIDIVEDDMAAPVRVIKSSSSLDDRFNAARGTYVPERATQPADCDPYVNAAFVAADGQREWSDFTFPFTSNKARARNLLRQFVEQIRAGMVIQVVGKMRLWPVEVGDRVTVTTVRLGLAADTFRVIDWTWSPGSWVTLTLQRDIAASYDDADASSADPAPSTRLPNPGLVDTPSGLAASSGTAQLQRLGDGTIVPRVLVTWTPPASIYMGDPSARIAVRWRRAADAVWQEIVVAGNSGSAYIDGVVDGASIVIGIQNRNSFGAVSPWVSMAHVVEGKQEPPAPVSGLSAQRETGGIVVTWAPSGELDYRATELRIGPSWAAAVRIWSGAGDRYTWAWPAPGAYTLWAAHVDTSGGYSAPASVAVMVESAAWPNGVNLCWSRTSFVADPGAYGDAVMLLKTTSENGHGLQPGEWLTLSADVWRDAASAAAGQTATLFLFAMDSAGGWKAVASVVGSTPVRTRSSVSLQLPAAADMASVGVGLYHQPAAASYPGSVYADRVQVERGRVPTEFSAGAAPGATRNLIYSQPSAPAAGRVGDIWFDTDDGNRLYIHDGSGWVARRDAGIDAALTAAASAQDTADGKIEVFYQAAPPSAGIGLGDLWFDTDDGNKLYRYSGSAWVVASDSRIGQALNDAATAQATADGKVTTYFGSASPIGADLGDLWYNDATKLLSRWSGSAWGVVSNAFTNTNQLVDGANLGGTATMQGQAANLINCSTEWVENTTEGWELGVWVTGKSAIHIGPELARDPSGAWVPPGSNALCVVQGARVTSSDTFPWGGNVAGTDATIFAVAYTGRMIPSISGRRYCISAYVAAHRCHVALHVEFLNAASQVIGGNSVATSAEIVGGRDLLNWTRLALFEVAPTGTVAMRLLWAKRNTWQGQADSFGWMTRPMIEVAGPQQTVPSDYSMGVISSHMQLGAVQTSDVAAGAVTASLIANNAVTTPAIADESVSKSFTLTARVASASAVSRVMGSVTANLVNGYYAIPANPYFRVGSKVRVRASLVATVSAVAPGAGGLIGIQIRPVGISGGFAVDGASQAIPDQLVSQTSVSLPVGASLTHQIDVGISLLTGSSWGIEVVGAYYDSGYTFSEVSLVVDVSQVLK